MRRGDLVTSDMLTARMTFHEKALWMLRAIIAQVKPGGEAARPALGNDWPARSDSRGPFSFRLAAGEPRCVLV